MEPKILTLGEKIRNYRKRAGISQFQLELEIDASPGSISRIENNEVNPTKETLSKIINALNLNSFEITNLMEIETNNFLSILEGINLIHSFKELDPILQNAINIISKELNFTAAAIFRVNEKKLRAYTVYQSWYTDAFYKLLPIDFKDYSVDLDMHRDNLVARSILENKPLLTNKLQDATLHAFPKYLSNAVSRLLNFKSGICVPLIDEERKVGAIFLVKNYEDDFHNELPYLKIFADTIAQAIRRTEQIEINETQN